MTGSRHKQVQRITLPLLNFRHIEQYVIFNIENEYNYFNYKKQKMKIEWEYWSKNYRYLVIKINDLFGSQYLVKILSTLQ